MSERTKLDPSTVQITGEVKGQETDKRFYIRGIEFLAKCPTCGHDITHMGGDYLSYKPIGEPFELTLWCDYCAEPEGEYNPAYDGHVVRVRLSIRMEVVPS